MSVTKILKYDFPTKLSPLSDIFIVTFAKHIAVYNESEQLKVVTLPPEIQTATGAISYIDGSFLVSDARTGLFWIAQTGNITQSIDDGNFADLALINDANAVLYGLEYSTRSIKEYMLGLDQNWNNTSNILAYQQLKYVSVFDALVIDDALIYVSTEITGMLHIFSRTTGKRLQVFQKFSESIQPANLLSFGNIICGVDKQGTALFVNIRVWKSELRFFDKNKNVWWRLQLPKLSSKLIGAFVRNDSVFLLRQENILQKLLLFRRI